MSSHRRASHYALGALLERDIALATEELEDAVGRHRLLVGAEPGSVAGVRVRCLSERVEIVVDGPSADDRRQDVVVELASIIACEPIGARDELTSS